MGLYLVQETFKPEAWNFFLENPGAAEGWTAPFTKNFETMKGKLHGLWFSHTNCNLIMIVEMPTDQDMTTILVTAFSRRFVQAMEVTPLWSADDLPKVLKNVSDVAPPVSSLLKDPPGTSAPEQTKSSAGETSADIKPVDVNKHIYDLTEQYPGLIEVLAGMGFSQIKNDILRNTVGRTMTLKSAMQNFGLESDQKFISTLKAAGFELTGQDS